MALLDDVAADTAVRITEIGLSVAGVEVTGGGYARQTPTWTGDTLSTTLAFTGPAGAGPVDGVVCSDGVTDLTFAPTTALSFNSDGRLDLTAWDFSVTPG